VASGVSPDVKGGHPGINRKLIIDVLNRKVYFTAKESRGYPNTGKNLNDFFTR